MGTWEHIKLIRLYEWLVLGDVKYPLPTLQVLVHGQLQVKFFGQSS